MKLRATATTYGGEVIHRHDADALVSAPGASALVHRGVDRSLVMVCPDGCGETLTINLDSRTGPAWRLYRGKKGLSLFPSVWRDTGCKSHFIVWQSRIYWCDWGDELDGTDVDFEARVLEHLPSRLRSYVEIADAIGAVPWAVLSACERLSRRGLAKAGTGNERSKYGRN